MTKRSRPGYLGKLTPAQLDAAGTPEPAPSADYLPFATAPETAEEFEACADYLIGEARKAPEGSNLRGDLMTGAAECFRLAGIARNQQEDRPMP